MTRSLNVPNELLTVVAGSNQCFIYYSDELEELLHQTFGRKGACLKAFRHPATPLDEFPWDPHKDGLLVECTKAQNLFALRGLAPFVYDIVLLNDTSWAQVTDYVGGAKPPTTSVSSKDVMCEFRISTSWDMNQRNWVQGYLVDFGGFHWKAPSRYEEDMKGRIQKYATWGSNPLPYQGDFGLPSQRDMEHRVWMMRLDEVEFEGKVVLDLGCSLGLFCQDALQRGAKRAVGIERGAKLTDLCYEVANWRGRWNVDFLDLNLPEERKRIEERTGIASFDIVYALSVDRQIGYASWMAEMCDGVFFLEGHVPDQEYTYRDRLEADFSEVEFLGTTRDHGPRPLFRCRR